MLKVLIADDHEIVRHGLKLILLEQFPFALIENAGNGEILVEKAYENEWDIIITDISMPVMTGLEALVEIRKVFPLLPTLVLSMHIEEHYYINALKAGASGYLSKTKAQEELIKAVQTILSGRKYFPEHIILNTKNTRPQHFEIKIHQKLSERELHVFKFLAEGKSIKEISETLSLDSSTISTYRSRILEKMNLNSNAELIRYALENSLS